MRARGDGDLRKSIAEVRGQIAEVKSDRFGFQFFNLTSAICNFCHDSNS